MNQKSQYKRIAVITQGSDPIILAIGNFNFNSLKLIALKTHY